MYLKPVSVVNRVYLSYLSLSVYGFRRVRLHFHSLLRQEESSSWCPLAHLLLAGGTALQTLLREAGKGLCMAMLLPSAELHGSKPLLADPSRC